MTVNLAGPDQLRWSRRLYSRFNARLAPVTFTMTLDDHAVVARALRVRAGDRVLALASAGDTPLNLLVEDPEAIVAVDRSPAQLHLARLKAAAVARLDVEQLRRLLGATPGSDRRDLYRLLRDDLDEPTRQFWDRHQQLVDRGLLWQGSVQRLAAVWGPAARLRHRLSGHRWLIDDNPYLAPLLLGRMPDEPHLPPYLRSADLPVIRRYVGRVSWWQGDLRAYLRSVPDRSFDCFALSNIGDWLPASGSAALFAQVARAARPGARVLVCSHRRRFALPAPTRRWFTPDPGLQRDLAATDRVRYFRTFHVLTRTAS